MYKIKIGDEVLFAENGTLLSDVLINNGKAVEHPCGGRGTCGKCKVLVDGREELSCRYAVRSDICVELFSHGDIVSDTGAIEQGSVINAKDVCLCLDIGTTTLAIALVDREYKNVLKVTTATNPQRLLGADVMSRIEHCRKNGVDKLCDLLIQKVNDMISEMGVDEKLPLFVSGNVTMLHTFFGVDCSSLGVSPYTAQFLESKLSSGEKLGLDNVDEVFSLPSVHTFFGADLTAGMGYTGFPKKGKYHLLVDLGTNAEIVLYSEKGAVCTSAAAGPCFEGANISCGMSAVSGAVCACERGGDGKLNLRTVGDCTPSGICGTGLVDIIACLVENGTIDESGYMECEVFEIAPDVYIDQKDIRQYQLAKSAVYSAVKTVMNIKNVGFEQIEAMYISGGFSSQINISNAVKTGLLPVELSEKCVPINNSSLLGTVRFACEKNSLSEYVSNAEYIDLSCDPMFSELFIDNMEFKKDV